MADNSKKWPRSSTNEGSLGAFLKSEKEVDAAVGPAGNNKRDQIKASMIVLGASGGDNNNNHHSPAIFGVAAQDQEKRQRRQAKSSSPTARRPRKGASPTGIRKTGRSSPTGDATKEGPKSTKERSPKTSRSLSPRRAAATSLTDDPIVEFRRCATAEDASIPKGVASADDKPRRCATSRTETSFLAQIAEAMERKKDNQKASAHSKLTKSRPARSRSPLSNYTTKGATPSGRKMPVVAPRRQRKEQSPTMKRASSARGMSSERTETRD